MTTQIQSAIQSLATSDTDSLLATLGSYAANYPGSPEKFVAAGADIGLPQPTGGVLDSVIELGKNILRRWHKTIYQLVCGGDEVDAAAKKQILDSIKIGSPEAMAAAITGVMIGVFSVAPAVAAVVGVLFGKLLLPAAVDETCKFWKTKLSV
jgi:hypothetical protein